MSLALLLNAAPTAWAASDLARGPENRYGQPLVDVHGHDITYDHDTLLRARVTPLPDAETSPATIAPDASTLHRPTFTYPLLGPGTGQNLWAGTTTSGTAEIYAGCNTQTFGANRYWVTLAYDAATSSYQPTFTSQYFPEGIVKIQVGDVAGDNGNEIVVALANGTIFLYDQLTKEVLGSFPTIPSATSMRLADVNGFGKPEIIMCGATGLGVYAGAASQWTVGVGGADLAVAQMDGDPAMEIAVGSGKIVDCATRSVQWDRGSIFGLRLEANDFDNDGKAELIAAEEWYAVRAFDVDLQTTKWSLPIELDITALALTDFDADGAVEVAIGEGQWGDIIAINPVDQSEKYRRPNPDHGVAGIAMADVDGDGSRELIWGAGFSSSGQDHLYVANPVTDAIEWQSFHLEGPVVGPVIGDLDGDGNDELVAASFESISGGLRGGRLLVFDNETLKLRVISQPVGLNISDDGIKDIKLRDMNQDGRMEILVATDYAGQGLLEIYDFNTSNQLTAVWRNGQRPLESPYTAMEVADIDGDGTLEILVGNARTSTFPQDLGTHLRVYDYETTSLEWTSFHFGGTQRTMVDVAISDVDTTPGLELLGLSGGCVNIFDGTTKALKGTVTTSTYTCMQVVGSSIYLGDPFGNIKEFRFNGAGYSMTSEVSLGNPLNGFNIISTSPLTLTYGTAGTWKYYAGGAVRAQTANYGAAYGVQIAGGASGGAGLLGVHRYSGPAPVIAEEPVSTSGDSNEIQWTTTAPGVVAFLLESDVDPDFPSPVSTGWIYTTGHTLNALPYGQNYFRVKSLFMDGVTESAWSAVVSTSQVANSTIDGWPLY